MWLVHSDHFENLLTRIMRCCVIVNTANKLILVHKKQDHSYNYAPFSEQLLENTVGSYSLYDSDNASLRVNNYEELDHFPFPVWVHNQTSW